jgi:hypothetical protein
MRFSTVFLAGSLSFVAASSAVADVACEKAFKNLKRVEAVQHHLQKMDIDRLFAEGRPAKPCSKERVRFEDNYAARAAEMAPVAKAFVEACGRMGNHMAELELYSNNDVLRPPPSSGRQGCGIAENRNPASVR